MICNNKYTCCRLEYAKVVDMLRAHPVHGAKDLSLKALRYTVPPGALPGTIPTTGMHVLSCTFTASTLDANSSMLIIVNKH